MPEIKYCVSVRFPDGTIKCEDFYAESEEKAYDLFMKSKEMVKFINGHKAEESWVNAGPVSTYPWKAVPTL